MSNPTPKRQGELVFSLLLIVFSVTAFWQSYAISGFTGLSTPGVFPMLASAAMIVATVCILLQNLFSASKPDNGFVSNLNDDDMPDSTSGQGFLQTILPLRLIIVVLLITGYVFAMPLVGFIVASALFLFLSFSYLWRKSLLVSLMITLVSVAGVYLIFRKLFQVVLPKGTLIQGWF